MRLNLCAFLPATTLLLDLADGAARVHINRPIATLTEAAGTVRVAFAIASAEEASLQAFGTAAAGADFMYASTQTLTFPAGATRAQTLTFPILDNDDVTWETEYFVRRP